MADLSKITLPNGSTYDIKDAVRGVEFVIGTQTAATGAWTGVTKREALFDGMQIKYFLPYAGSGAATLNLTLAGGTTTGAKPIYRYGTTTVTTHYNANSVIGLTYSTHMVATGAWYSDAEYWTDNNDYDRLVMNSASIKAKTAITSDNIVVAGSDGQYFHLKTGQAFDVTYPILYASAAIAAGGSSNGNTYVSIPFAIATTQSLTLTVGESVYIQGTLTGSMFLPISSTPLRQAIPEENNGYEYIYLGQAYSATNMWLSPYHPILHYKHGAVREVVGDNTTAVIGDCALVYNDSTKALDFVFE